jgi:acetolactate synthase-1/3 small subunit
MALFKVVSSSKKQGKAKKLCNKYNSVIVDKTNRSIVLQVTALKSEIDKLVSNLGPLGLASVSRTGAVAMTKGSEVFK